MTFTFSGSEAIYCYVTYSKVLPTLMELTSERVKDTYQAQSGLKHFSYFNLATVHRLCLCTYYLTFPKLFSSMYREFLSWTFV